MISEQMYQLTPHVYIFPFCPLTDRPNLIYLKGDQHVLMFDAGLGPSTVDWVQQQLHQHNLKQPEGYLISHFHWDHSFAAGYLKGKVYSSQYTYDMMKEMRDLAIQDIDELTSQRYMTDFCRAHMHMEYQDASKIIIRPADCILPKETTMELGNLTLQLAEVVNSHCEGSIVCYIQQDRVLLVGDSNSGKVVGMDFVENDDLLNQFYQRVMQWDFQTIILSHYPPFSRTEYQEMMEKRLENLRKGRNLLKK